MKILWISDAIDKSTGFGTQSLNITTGLQELGHEIVTLGWHSDTEKKYQNIPIYPLYGSFSNVMLILNKYYSFNPDIIISYGDIHMVQHMIVDIRDSNFKDRWIHWLPVDGDPYPDRQDSLYQEIKTLVVASQFGEDVFRENYKGDLRTIYNAIDPQQFFPMQKENLQYPEHLKDKFVCLFVGMNQGRKKIPLLFDAFQRFAENKNDVVLVLHTTPKPLQPTFQGWDIPSLIKRSSLGDAQNPKALISSDVISTSKLNKLYNLAHVFVSATGGEGFNLPAAESMMAGTPVVLTDYTTGAEFIGKGDDRCGELIKVSALVPEGPLSTRKAIIDVDDLAQKLEILYLDWKSGGLELKHRSEKARTRALNLFSKEKIVKIWDETIKSVHKKLSVEKINLAKTVRSKKTVIFVDDITPNQWIGGTQLSTKRIIDQAEEFGMSAKCVTIAECDIAELYSANLIVLNNIHETASTSPGILSEIVTNLDYVKWEHDFNFCHTRDFRCAGIEQKCQTECKTKQFRDIYANAKSMIFQSPLHYKTFRDYFGEKVIHDHIVLPPPVDPDPFIKARENKNREARFLWSGLMHPFRGIEEAISYAEKNPDRQFVFHTAYPPYTKSYFDRIKALPNCTLLEKQIPYDQMPDLFSSCTDYLYQPNFIDASSRASLEAFLSGCRLRPNQNVGLMSYDWDWTDVDAIAKTIKDAPKIFWEHIKSHLKDAPVKVKASKVNVVFFPSGMSSGEKHLPSSHIRVYTVSEQLKKFGYGVQVVDSDLPDEIKFSMLSNLKANDIVYVQKTFNPFNRAKNFSHIKGNNVIIYDVDDYYEERNQQGEISHMFNSDAMAKLADLVVVGSHRLQGWNRKNNRNVRVIASLVDDTIYKYKPREEREPHQVKILWTEKDGHIYLEDLMMVKRPLDELHRKYGVQLILQAFGGAISKEVQEIFPYAKVLDLVPFKEYVSQRVPLMADCDFFIAPFSKESRYAVEKTFKAGQNSRHIMGLGLPGVATPTGEHDYFIEDGVNGFLAKTEEEWFNKMEMLITNNALRIQMGFKSRQVVEQRYTIDRTIRQILETINSVKTMYYNPSVEVIGEYKYKALVTIKYGSSGGGTLTSSHIRDILENVGYKTDLLYCDKVRGSKDNYVLQVNEQKLNKPILLREYAQKCPVDVIYFDDVQRYEKAAAQYAQKNFLILCGCANVHEEYYTEPIVMTGAQHVTKVFVKNYALSEYLRSIYGDKFVYWQGGIDAQKLRSRYGRATYKHPKEGCLLTSSFSKGWWKNPTMASLAAFRIWKKFPRTKYFKPILRDEDYEFSKNTQFKILGNKESIPREQLLETLVKSQLGLEVYLADAFPRTLLDYFALGVPLITSGTITFLSGWEILQENLVVVNPNDPLAVSQKALDLLEDREKWEMVSAACIEFTKTYSFQWESDVLIKESGLKVREDMKIPQLDSSNVFLHEEELHS